MHYLVYADLFDTEGLISSPPHGGRKEHILEAINAYEIDYPKLRVYFISSWNRRMDPSARDYVVEQHPDLWLIDSDTTFRGMYVGGLQEKDLGNREFLARHVEGHGALGDLLVRKKADIKMGDTPSVLYLLRGDPAEPTGESWGGSFVRPDPQRTYWTDNPDPALREAAFPGARTVNRWRPQYLRDWQQRIGNGARGPSSSRPTATTARCTGVAIWAGRSSRGFGIRRLSSLISMAMDALKWRSRPARAIHAIPMAG